MIYILIVDDNRHRADKLQTFIKTNITDDLYEMVYCDNTNEAKELMIVRQYDLVILDVVLPKRKKHSIATAEEGLKLLKEINSYDSEMFTPKKIIGITNRISEFKEFNTSFNNHTSVILEARTNDQDWINSIYNNISILIKSHIAIKNIKKDNLLITYHGIRTHGYWQDTLKNLIDSKVNSFEHIKAQYGFFSLFLFIFPFLRNIIINKLFEDFEKIIEKNYDKKIYIVAHSFGTEIVLKLIEKANLNIKIETMIFSGSVIKDNYKLNSLLETKVKRIINECAQNDKVLVANKLLIPSLGDAGRIGFTGYTNKDLVNRFFIGGHSVYFNKDTDFMGKYWLPLLIDNDTIRSIDQRNAPAFYSDFTEGFLSLWMYIKNYVLYSIPFLLFLYILIKLIYN
jgi:CheY-like chemotaxis protein